MVGDGLSMVGAGAPMGSRIEIGVTDADTMAKLKVPMML